MAERRSFGEEKRGREPRVGEPSWCLPEGGTLLEH